jgi:hypothetical protein
MGKPTAIPVPIFARGCLPTEDRPRIGLHFDQRVNFAEAHVDKVTPAPILDHAVRLDSRLILVAVSFLAVGLQTKKAQHANCAEC